RLVLCPIRSIPCELLVEIFRVALSSPDGASHYWEVPVKDVLVLSQVCAYWRKVAHTTPPLW
ncbi:hypothetical protein DFH09DRAFT_841997, partial [Mycena vulgaris]